MKSKHLRADGDTIIVAAETVVQLHTSVLKFHFNL